MREELGHRGKRRRVFAFNVSEHCTVLTVRAWNSRYCLQSFLHSSDMKQLEKMNFGDESAETFTQTDSLIVADKAIQTEAFLGSKENPLLLEEEDIYDPHDAVSDEEENDDTSKTDSRPAPDEDKFFFGTAFEKVEEFDHHLNDLNPWHPDLNKPLFPSQIIGFRWMASRHAKGGGLIGDKVGCGKVLFQSL